MSNDNKYVRLYPERAVAPARVVLEKLAPDSPIAKAALIALDRDGFPPDEPLFLLRGQDELASNIVRAYADAVFHSPGAFVGQGLIDAHLQDFADRMERWTPRRMPD